MSLDNLPRDSQSQPHPFCDACAVTTTKKKERRSFSLGLSALAGVGQDSQDPVLERAMHYLYQHTNRFYNFKGLHEFKDKFHPDWEPRYLIYPGPASLPMVAAALARVSADLPPLPFLKKRI